MAEIKLVSDSPQMVRIPSLAQYSEHRLYEDVLERGRVYVDSLEPRMRLSSTPGGPADPPPAAFRAARPVAVEFGPSERDLRGIQKLMPTQRVVPMTWNSGPFFAWTRSSSGVAPLDQGTTKRGSTHSAELRGVQPAAIELARAVAAAELVHWGRLCGLSVKATAGSAAVAELRNSVRLGRRAVWSATVGDALRAQLDDLLRRDRLRVIVASGPVPLRAFDEIREWVLAEWAHRMVGDMSLAQSAANVDALPGRGPVDLTIDWRDGDRIPMRVVRSLRYESLAADSVNTLAFGLTGGVGRGTAARI